MMHVLRFFLLVFGLLLMVVSLVVGNARRHLMDELWTVRMTAISYYQKMDVTILPDGRQVIQTVATTPADLQASGRRSPDGKWALSVDMGGATASLVRMRADGSDRHVLATMSNLSSGTRDLNWSPNSEWIVFSSILQRGQMAVMVVMRRDGSERVDIDIPDNHYNYVWSSDSEWILFYREHDGDVSLWRVARDGTDMRQVLAADAVDMSWAYLPLVSPDNEWIYFNALDDGQPQVYRVRQDGSDFQSLTTSDQHILMSVSPNGHYLGVASFTNRGWMVYRVGVDGADPIPVSRPTLEIPITVAWSSGGDAVAYVENTGTEWNLMRYNDDHLIQLYTFWGRDIESLSISSFKTLPFQGTILALVGGLLSLMGGLMIIRQV